MNSEKITIMEKGISPVELRPHFLARVTLAVDGWIAARSIALHRDDRSTLIDSIVEELTRSDDEKRPEGIG